MPKEISHHVKSICLVYCSTTDLSLLKMQILKVIEVYKGKPGSIYQNVGLSLVKYLKKYCNSSNKEIKKILIEIEPKLLDAINNWGYKFQ